jgi:hypothetical protein
VKFSPTEGAMRKTDNSVSPEKRPKGAEGSICVAWVSQSSGRMRRAALLI